MLAKLQTAKNEIMGSNTGNSKPPARQKIVPTSLLGKIKLCRSFQCSVTLKQKVIISRQICQIKSISKLSQISLFCDKFDPSSNYSIETLIVLMTSITHLETDLKNDNA